MSTCCSGSEKKQERSYSLLPVAQSRFSTPYLGHTLRHFDHMFLVGISALSPASEHVHQPAPPHRRHHCIEDIGHAAVLSSMISPKLSERRPYPRCVEHVEHPQTLGGESGPCGSRSFCKRGHVLFRLRPGGCTRQVR